MDFCKFRLTRRGNKAKSVAEMGTSMARFRISQMAEGPTLVDLPLYAVCRMQAELDSAGDMSSKEFQGMA